MVERDTNSDQVHITRTASQQIMHYALAAELDHQSIIHGQFYYDQHNHITNIAPSKATGPKAEGGLWLAHNGASTAAIAHYLMTIAHNYSNETFPIKQHLLLNIATKGRLELTAFQFNTTTLTEDPVIITELPVALIEDFPITPGTEQG
ncbi:MAG: hypothetical protein R8J84_05050 [Mariprofundales bacterium]